ncbi:prepilin-type N-terminal cleavage/methylation domain-containing protein [Vibrio breoganii]|uniref:prepilin-type N-terminal cleavage/methylation domain-containing protein n=1 Tax=Vibrio breoganii TaxID=553239 RepID=UPI000C85A695|nr:prepilin-type N-terminal cleavage/methylation domain-containing protein [Vibrio breoganii]PMG01689.1 prepilin-type N-terminal cleavage/methylation domain-containing protein [Vibrio breoganii]PMH17833.1 prepilin-type N-terminal cleavage/methylation domain-containing protein [Vibrio breoganii]PML35623.1 prepilin-type N-terminal cleavage/methylation domain-containing protein [Vibrio breoganii]PMM18990.1 prepilin-type N-terminal cleavage/methylation domain-containing protein [Vibrio breoganii]T
MNHPRTKHIKGFTLVELIVVIIVVAIMSLYAASKFIGVSQFSAQAAQQQGIAVIRQIQLGRMQSNIQDTDALHDRYSLLVTAKCLGSQQACTSVTTEPFSHKVVIEEQDLSFTPAMSIDFDLLGNPICSSACPEPIRIQIASTQEQESICINSQGYVYGC